MRIVLVVAFIAVGLTACATRTQTASTAVGAGVGAVAGGPVGAVAGAGVGAVVGAPGGPVDRVQTPRRRCGPGTGRRCRPRA